MTTPSEKELRLALASILLVENNDNEGVVEGIDGNYFSLLQGFIFNTK